ncbi:MAG: SIS domain-containing protein [Candidatus Aminicenantes bacterium]|nr:SIS domain-containing protein [Candidatus Aminicenantes bacterium]
MCGIIGILPVKKPFGPGSSSSDLKRLESLIAQAEERNADSCLAGKGFRAAEYLGGPAAASELMKTARSLRDGEDFQKILFDAPLREGLKTAARRLEKLIQSESAFWKETAGRLEASKAEPALLSLEELKDASWCLSEEVLGNAEKVRALAGGRPESESLSPPAARTLRHLNLVLNSLDRLEVRGRDSAGLSVTMTFDRADFEEWEEGLGRSGLRSEWTERTAGEDLRNRSVSFRRRDDGGATVIFTYKIVAEVGSLGDNVRFLRGEISGDALFQSAVRRPARNLSIISHTRWASVGAIDETNCHPVDNRSPATAGRADRPLIHVCLNGDIDNYLEIRGVIENNGLALPGEVASDTKIIPLRVADHFRRTGDVREAFRLAVNEFKGSHAIALQTDLEPGKIFLAQRGSGQALFIGLAADMYVAVSEVYGLVEAASSFVKLNGEAAVPGPSGPVQGQIFVLDQESGGGLAGIRAFSYNGDPVALKESDVKSTPITSRDIDRQGFPHYFIKEINESPLSVEKTLMGRWTVTGDGRPRYEVRLDESVISPRLRTALEQGRIRRFVFIGQGTAGVAAQSCADILKGFLDDASFQVQSMRASELSGFSPGREGVPPRLEDTLVVAISQSGTTADTNRTIDLVRSRGAHTLAVVNRRDSDLTFKVEGVLYTSSGRDVEMSVASTKAFYAQIVAGALLGLEMARIAGRRDEDFISGQIRLLLKLPEAMRRVLAQSERFENSARRTALSRTYWAAVGSGPNKSAADEIRIKLSELCYKTISSDYIEDKKHIDLSSEPLIIVCAAGVSETVLCDLVKEAAIFRAHKAVPLVIADEDEDRFAPYAEDVFSVPRLEPHLAPVVATLAGHLWGYYAALAINDGAKFLDDFRRELASAVEDSAARGLDVYDLILDPSFRETLARFYTELRKRQREGRLPSASGFDRLADLLLLLKYLSGRLPASDFELDFGVKGTALIMLQALQTGLSEAVNRLSRPVDAIRHQAKTVTVGTSRISDRLEGLLFDALAGHGVQFWQLTARNIHVLKNLQSVVEGITGSSFYRIDGLNLLGEPTDRSTIEVLRKGGTLRDIPSRVESDRRLQGTKSIIVRQGNVYIGRGRKDGLSILIVPVLSASPARPNIIEFLLLLHIDFRSRVPLEVRIKALGGKYEHIKNIVQETKGSWDDLWLDRVSIEDLFGLSAEKVAESLLSSKS